MTDSHTSCPFCGGTDLYAEHGDMDCTYVKCNTCFAGGPALIAAWTDMEEGEAERKAYALWDRRGTDHQWVSEVHPAKTREGAARIEITWEQWNSLRRACGLKEQPEPRNPTLTN